MPCLAKAQAVDQGAIAHHLQFGSNTEQYSALAALKGIPVDQRAYYILSALTDLLLRQSRDFQQRQSGALLVGRADTARIEVVDLTIARVSEYDDPTVIEPLLPFINHGTLVQQVLGRFGELAVDHVIGIAAIGSGVDDNQLAGALNTLRNMLDGTPTKYALTDQSKERIVAVARERLRERPLNVYSRLIALASRMTDDPEVREVLQLLATDAAAAEAAGGGPNMVVHVQADARAALSGERLR